MLCRLKKLYLFLNVYSFLFDSTEGSTEAKPSVLVIFYNEPRNRLTFFSIRSWIFEISDFSKLSPVMFSNNSM